MTDLLVYKIVQERQTPKRFRRERVVHEVPYTKVVHEQRRNLWMTGSARHVIKATVLQVPELRPFKTDTRPCAQAHVGVSPKTVERNLLVVAASNSV